LSITKKVLAKKISIKLNLTAKDSLDLVNGFFSSITRNFDKNINIQNFGSFLLKKTPKRIGRNPKTMENFEIKARKKLNFKPSEDIKKSIN
tara:strand:- start:202 stop:474 length:273 start_codon:yes stop_codon:yes gene_type:complete